MKQGIFISYRRDTGSTMARMIYDRLRLEKKYPCFLDVEKLNAGNFREHIAQEMDKCDIFLLILSKNALNRCVDPHDNVRQEIELALEKHIPIIPVMSEDFAWPDPIPTGLESITDLNGVPYIQVYSEQFFERLYSFIGTIRAEERTRENASRPAAASGGKKKKLLPLIGAAVAVILLAVLCFSRLGKDTRQNDQNGGKSQAQFVPTAEAGLPEETEVPEAQDDPGAEEEQILPESFLLEMETLAEKRLAGLLVENVTLEFGTDDGKTRDVNTRSIQLGDMELRRDALYFETGGTAAFFLYYQGTVSISGEETAEYPEAIVAFKLDSFPQKFYSAMHGGENRYKNSDFGVFLVVESKEEYLRRVYGGYQYVDRDVYELQLP